MAAKPKSGAKKPAANRPSLKLTEFTHATSMNNVITATGAKKSGKLLLVPLDKIKVMPGFNLRITDSPEYKAGIEELKQSMLLEGFYESKPLSAVAATVDGEDVVAIIDGHRRYEAAIAAVADGAEFETLPVVLKPPTASDIDLAVSLQKENASVPLSMLERAVLAQRMLKWGMTDEEVAERLQVTPRHVNDLRVIITAPKAVRDLIRESTISATEAVIQLRKDPTGAKIIEAAEKAAAREAEQETKKAANKGGNTRLTRQTIEDDAPQVKMTTYKANFQTKAGATFMYEDAEPFMRVIGDDNWFKAARKQTERIALEDLSIEVKIRRPKQPDDAAGATDAAAAADDGLGEDNTDDGFGDDNADAPDLHNLGIAERANADL